MRISRIVLIMSTFVRKKALKFLYRGLFVEILKSCANLAVYLLKYPFDCVIVYLQVNTAPHLALLVRAFFMEKLSCYLKLKLQKKSAKQTSEMIT